MSLSSRVADRWMKEAKKPQHWMGVNVTAWQGRFLSEQDQIDQWWIDLEKLVREYWSLQKVKIGWGSSRFMWAQIPAAVSGPLEVQFVGGPSNMHVTLLGRTRLLGTDNRKFGPGDSLKDILLWVDKIDRLIASETYQR